MPEILEINCQMLENLQTPEGQLEVLCALADWAVLRTREERITLPVIASAAIDGDTCRIFGVPFPLADLQAHLDAARDPREFLQTRVLLPLRQLKAGERPPQPHDSAGCCEQARHVITYMPKNTTLLKSMLGGGCIGPDLDGWAFGDEFRYYRVNFCPFCGTKAANIKPRKQ